MKETIKTYLSRLTGGILIFAAALSFTACENFLTGDDIKEQIETEIAYNNAKDVNIFISCKEDMGTVFPQQSYKAKLGYEFEIQFVPNTENYLIKDSSTILEAVSRINPEESRSNYVEFKAVEQSFQDKQNGLYRIKAKVTKNSDDIMIQPACIEVPRVVSIYPTLENGYCAANTPITIDFNLEVEDSNVLEKIMLLLASDNSDVSAYFEAPYLSEDKKSVIIEPKSKKLAAFIQKDLKAAFAELEVSLNDDIKIMSDERELTLSDNGGRVFKLRYKPELEETAPKNYGFFAFTSNSDDIDVTTVSSNYSGNKFTTDALADFDDDKIMQNRTKGTVYIWGRYFDEGSGVKTITLTEKRTNDKKGNEVNDEAIKPAVYTSKDITFVKDETGNTEFCIEYHIKSDDGAVLLTISASDGCENVDAAENKSVVAIKDSGMDLSELELENTSTNLSEVYFADKITYINEDSGREQIYNEGNDVNPYFKNRKIVYGACIIPTEKLTMVVEYKDITDTTKSQQLTFKKDTKTAWGWSPGVGDISFNTTIYKYATALNLTEDTIAEKQLKLIVTDDIGNVTEKYFSFPSQPKVARVEKQSSLPYFYFANRGANDKIYLQWKEGDDIDSLEASETELAVKGRYATNVTYTAQCLRGGLYGKKTEEFTESTYASLTPLSLVNVTGFDYTKNAEQGKTNVSVLIADDSWDLYDDIYYLCNNLGITEPVHFTKGKTVSVFTTDTYRLFSAATNPTLCSITVFGMKGESMSAGQTKYPKLTDISFDNVPPTVYTHESYSNPYGTVLNYSTSNGTIDYLKLYNSVIVCAASDEMSGIDYMTMKVSDNAKEIRYDADKHYSQRVFIIPYNDLNGSDSCHITVYDKAGNSTSRDTVVRFMETPKTYYTDRTHIQSFLTKSLNDLRYKWDYTFLKWDNNTWVKAYNYKSDYASSGSIYNSGWYVVPKNIDERWAEADKLYKVIVKFEDKDSKYCATTTPLYFYNGKLNLGSELTPEEKEKEEEKQRKAWQSTGKYDYIIPKTNKSVLISSDSVTFVQTLVTKRPYSECKDWSEDEWQYHRKSIGEERLDFSSTNSAAQKYTIPYAQINEGECYVVIAHFANGGTDISEVFQK